MLKPTLIALATLIGAGAALPSVASAIDKGPCDHCTMEPIVVKGDRKKTKSTGKNLGQATTNRSMLIWLGR